VNAPIIREPSAATLERALERVRAAIGWPEHRVDVEWHHEQGYRVLLLCVSREYSWAPDEWELAGNSHDLESAIRQTVSEVSNDLG
jgi:hypothetical protein